MKEKPLPVFENAEDYAPQNTKEEKNNVYQ